MKGEEPEPPKRFEWVCLGCEKEMSGEPAGVLWEGYLCPKCVFIYDCQGEFW